MPPRKRISNIARLLPRKRSSTPDVPVIPPQRPQRDCTSLPAGFRAPLVEHDSESDVLPVSGQDVVPESLGVQSGLAECHVNDGVEIADTHQLELRDHRNHRFAQRYETNQLPYYRDYPQVEEDVPHSLPQQTSCEEEKEEKIHVHEPCDIPSLRHEVRLLRHDHALLSETARETLRLAEALEARIESMQRSARPSERLFWLLLDGVSAVLLFLLSVIVRPWGMVKRYFVADRVAKRRSWRISVGDFENDPFLGDVAKRLSFSAVDD